MPARFFPKPAFITALILGLLLLPGAPAWAQADLASLNGVYRMHQLGCGSGLADWSTGIDEYAFDGAGLLGITPVASSQGGAGGGYLPAIYEVDPDGVWRMQQFNTLKGMVSPAGDLAVLYQLSPSESGLTSWVGIPKSAGLSNAVVSGDYRMHHFGYNLTQGYFISQVFAMTADGAGNGSWELIADSKGQTGTLPLPWTYSVGEDGVSTPSPNANGMVSADGGKIVSSVVDPAQPARVRSIALKLGSDMNPASLQGVYIVHEHQIYDNLSAQRTGRTEMSFDGAGGLTFQSLDDSNGASQSGSGTYVIEPNGALSLSLPDRVWIGTLSADRNVLVLSDADASDGTLAVNIGIKKSTSPSEETSD